MAGLALVGMLAGCGGDDAVSAEPMDTAVPSTTSEPGQPPKTPMQSQTVAPITLRGESFSVEIPRLKVEAPVVEIEAKNRVLDPPRNPRIVGWWRDGAAPGDETGSAIIVGHTVSTGGGVFDDVDRLRPGDTVQVKSKRATLTYQVATVDVLSKDELARQAETVFSQTTPGRLVLVTCEDWDGKVYHSNVIAIARPV